MGPNKGELRHDLDWTTRERNYALANRKAIDREDSFADMLDARLDEIIDPDRPDVRTQKQTDVERASGVGEEELPEALFAQVKKGNETCSVHGSLAVGIKIHISSHDYPFRLRTITVRRVGIEERDQFPYNILGYRCVEVIASPVEDIPSPTSNCSVGYALAELGKYFPVAEGDTHEPEVPSFINQGESGLTPVRTGADMVIAAACAEDGEHSEGQREEATDKDSTEHKGGAVSISKQPTTD